MKIDGYTVDDRSDLNDEEVDTIVRAIRSLSIDSMVEANIRYQLSELLATARYFQEANGQWCITCRWYRGLEWRRERRILDYVTTGVQRGWRSDQDKIETYCHVVDTCSMQYSAWVGPPFECPYHDHDMWTDGQNVLNSQEFTEKAIADLDRHVKSLKEDGSFERTAAGTTRVYARPFFVGNRWDLIVEGTLRWWPGCNEPRTRYLRGSEEDALRVTQTIRDFLEDAGVAIDGTRIIDSSEVPGEELHGE